MAKGYWLSCYRSVSNPEALAKYAELAAPAIRAAGGIILAQNKAAKVYEAGKSQRTVIIEFESVEKAIACYESEAYQAALKVFQGAAERDLRIVEGVR
jgi:uncharacterized protein (DUF1330 family)